MLAFRILINGEPVCTASADSVVTAIATLKGKQTAGEVEPPDLHVSGMTDENTHATWAAQSIAVGDKITIEVVEALDDELTEPIKKRQQCAEVVEVQRRAYYEQLKQVYEPDAAMS